MLTYKNLQDMNKKLLQVTAGEIKEPGKFIFFFPKDSLSDLCTLIGT